MKPEKTIKKDRFFGGLVGYIAYDAVHNYIEGNIVEPSVFGFYRHGFIYDHLTNEFYFFSLDDHSELNPDTIVSRAKRIQYELSNKSSDLIGCDAKEDEFIEIVQKGKEYIFAGDVFQVVLSREYTINTDMDPLSIYMNLRKINPSPYMFLLEFQEKILVGASPETMASVEGKTVKINPIAGTAPRGKNKQEDLEIERKLLNDEKERAEHVMLVDLARNDVRRVSKPGSVRLVRFFDVVRYSHVMHIESEVVGELAEDKTMFDAIEAAFPAGTLTGAPKIRAIEIIDELEKSPRRVYGGAVGYFSVTGWADFAIAIRMVEMEGKIARVRAGAGIVADSIPEKEFIETENKMKAVLKALGARE
ncbi:anthranilate synthase component I [Thermococcus sp. M39]|uniref:anthranilate synthase component I n=1 Tax=unclassified Thermococcus TaxID=2627626 RepID=UPI00143AA090|nr:MULTISPECIES: anthranilate synthase component I [unclassified Thermococcus]NJE07486.1 anthranilate synthase component I [Thermococcus sp. M39]NJE12381.1 anthranilate synthase component I [Thermococcus sp. LS2]